MRLVWHPPPRILFTPYHQRQATRVRHQESNSREGLSYRPMATIYTIGHSTRTLDELVRALQGHEVKTLVDIRSFPMSRRLPQFNRESLEQELPKHGIAYLWIKELGGRRKKIRNESPNTALRNESFRNYADYMMTPEFAAGTTRLLEIAERGKTAIMCAER